MTPPGTSGLWFGLGIAVAILGSAHGATPRIYAWGDNFYGQTNVPPSATNAVAISAGNFHALALLSNGTIVSWGQNIYQQTNNQPSLTNVMAIDGGGYHSLALRSNGTVYGWGLNSQGQRNIPIGLSGVKAISAGDAHSLALLSNGTVRVWGSNANGQTNMPAGLSNVVAISAGHNHSLALKYDGTVVGWGEDDSGQAAVPGHVTNIMAIGAGYHHSLAVRSNGTVVAWGVNVYGEAEIPPGLSNVVAVSAGYFHSAALRSDGIVVAWGQEFSGVTNVPVGLNGVMAIASGWEFDLALSAAPLCPPGLPDAFECRQLISGSSISNLISNLGSTREPGEPLHGGASSSNSIWYSWTAPAEGSVVIEATTDFDFASPILAVYTGETLASVASVAFNFGPFNGAGSPLNKARVAYTAVSNQTYQIAVDGDHDSSSTTEGDIAFTLILTPPPANDLFQDAEVISGLFHEITNGTFRGASREPGEPDHGSNFLQTVWWRWTAPTNLNLTTIPVRLSADAVSHPPAIGIYTGASVDALTPLTSQQYSDGMSRTATFTATAGNTYHFALAGLQNDVESVLPLVGDFRFRFNTRALGLDIKDLVSTLNATGAVEFTATACVTNLGSAATGDLRVRVTSVPGISMRGPNVLPIFDVPEVLSDWPVAPRPVGQSANLSISGIAPPHTEVGAGTRSALGYGVHAELQEWRGSTEWLTVDETLVVYGDWPVLDGLPGPGGGVIRLDPGFIGGSAFNPLIAVKIIGPPAAIEGQPTGYFGRANYASGLQFDFTNTVWLATLPTVTNGLFTPGVVTSNTPVELTAQFSDSGFLHNITTNATVINLPPAQLKNATVSTAGFVMRIEGVSNRIHVVEAATNLSAPVFWQPVGTNNLGPAGAILFTNPIGAVQQHFFRAREVD